MNDVVDAIFSHPPKPPCTFLLEGDTNNMFIVLFSILIEGTKRLYGPQATPSTLTNQQVQRIQSYMESLGYSLKYRVRDLEPGSQHKGIDIWFVPYIPKYTCHGIPYV
ncbi:hypothetical protein EBZ38_07060 [bacterium]|nr:hypothetical protein [bacterium]NDC94449.1 hypothetical protein [bacterium]NDD84022.1 hypothetical protein [bacterium]